MQEVGYILERSDTVEFETEKELRSIELNKMRKWIVQILEGLFNALHFYFQNDDMELVVVCTGR